MGKDATTHRTIALAWTLTILLMICMPAASHGATFHGLTSDTTCTWHEYSGEFLITSSQLGIIPDRGHGERADQMQCDWQHTGVKLDDIKQLTIRPQAEFTSIMLDTSSLRQVERGTMRVHLVAGKDQIVWLQLDLDHEYAKADRHRVRVVASSYGLDLSGDGQDDVTFESHMQVVPRIWAPVSHGLVDLRNIHTRRYPKRLGKRTDLRPWVYVGGSGNATVYAPRDVSSVIDTVQGHDRVVGSSADDEIRTGHGRDIIRSGRGRDLILSGPQGDRVWSGPGDDFVYPDYPLSAPQEAPGRWSAPDYVFAGTGRDVVQTHGGQDRIFGQQGHDILRDATMIDRLSFPILNGGPGNDTITAAQPWTVAFAQCGPGHDSVRVLATWWQLYRYRIKVIGKTCEQKVACEPLVPTWMWDYTKPVDTIAYPHLRLRRCSRDDVADDPDYVPH